MRYRKEMVVTKRYVIGKHVKYSRYPKRMEKNQYGDPVFGFPFFIFLVKRQTSKSVIKHVAEILLFVLKIATYVEHISSVGMELQVRILYWQQR